MKQRVHGEAQAEDNPADRTSAAGHVTMEGHLAGKVVAGRSRAVELSERNLEFAASFANRLKLSERNLELTAPLPTGKNTLNIR